MPEEKIVGDIAPLEAALPREKKSSTVQAWVSATRPKTLPAALGPVLVGTALAAGDGELHSLAAFSCLAVAVLLQIAVNLANDYFDGVGGVDGEDRIGPVRATQAGLLSPRAVKWVTFLTLGASLIPGGYLIFLGGWPIALLAVFCILSALAYSGGPFPLASHGLGDLFVFIFFGPVAVVGTYYLQAGMATQAAFLASLPVGFLITAILVVNNLRDIETDRRAGKNTLAVIIGGKWTRIEYILLLAAAFFVPAVGVLEGPWSVFALLPWVTAVPALRLCFALLVEEGPILNFRLAQTAKLSFFFSLFFALGILI
jgi:1,4-dihydroxy-2-naphthoate octaprenyltransferase